MLMISCKKASELICQSIDRPLSVWEKARLRFHLLMCRGCTTFQKQNEVLLRLFERRFHGPDEPGLESQVQGLSQDVCNRLKQRLQEAQRLRPPQ